MRRSGDSASGTCPAMMEEDARRNVEPDQPAALAVEPWSLQSAEETDQWGSLLSGGEQRGLAFARVLHPPDVLIMHELNVVVRRAQPVQDDEYMRDLLPDTMVTMPTGCSSW